MEKWTRWFELDNCSDELAEDELSFLTALQKAAAQWDVGYAASWAIRDTEEHPCLLAVVTISDSVRRVSLGQFGVHYRDQHAQGDLLHDCLHELPDEPTPLALDVRGSPEHVAAECAAWFETILSKPVSHQRWHHNGRLYAEAWKFGDNGDVLAQSYRSAAAPPKKPKRWFRKARVDDWPQVSDRKDPPTHENRVR